jgi:glyoxylase-like metal-dependent hydrolase (beta-lactamase superfamily II)
VRRQIVAVCVIVCLAGLSGAIPILGQDAKTILTNTAKAMGAENLRTIQLSASGSNAGVGQNVNPNVAWPVARVKTYSRQIDFGAGTSQVDLIRVQAGADQAQSQYVSSGSPWNSQYSFWITPFGFIKGATANNAAVSSATMDGTKYTVVTFTLQNKYKIAGYINGQNLVERVHTSIDNEVLGDMPVEAWYTDYKDFGGVKFPTMIVEKHAGFPVSILAVSDVKPNAAVTIASRPADTAAGAAVQAVSARSEKVADGVFYLKGGTHHSVAVEFSDHVAVIEAPLNEERSLAVIAEVKKLFPNKPIRYVINTHHHFDHAGGLRTYVAEGATVVTHETNSAFLAKALSNPRTVNPDRLALAPKNPTIESVTDKKSLSDGTRTLELHFIRENPHHDGLLTAFLPKEKILIEADVYTPGNPATNNRIATNFVDTVEKSKLDFETILPLHGAAAAARADLYAAVGKPVPDIKDILAPPPPAPAAGQRGAGGQAVPASAGQQILDKACSTCHNLNRVQNKKLNQADWETTVARMRGRGAEISDSDVAALVEYLVKTYGPQ